MLEFKTILNSTLWDNSCCSLSAPMLIHYQGQFRSKHGNWEESRAINCASNDLVNSKLVTGIGAVRFTGPASPAVEPSYQSDFIFK